MQDRSVFRDVDLLPPKHGVDPSLQTGFVRQLKEKFECFIGDAVLRIVEVDSDGLGGHAFAPFGIIGEEPSEMKFSKLLMVGFESFPCGACGEQFDTCCHVRNPFDSGFGNLPSQINTCTCETQPWDEG